MPRLLFVAASLALAAAAPLASAPPLLRDATQGALPELMALYRRRHANLEFGRQEVRAPKLAEEARKAGFDVIERVGGTGVAAVLENCAGRVVLVRTDMDGVPTIQRTISVGGVPQPKSGEAAAVLPADAAQPLLGPDAKAIIGTATKAMTAAALDLLGR
jgi:hypothetical protein